MAPTANMIVGATRRTDDALASTDAVILYRSHPLPLNSQRQATGPAPHTDRAANTRASSIRFRPSERFRLHRHAAPGDPAPSALPEEPRGGSERPVRRAV